MDKEARELINSDLLEFNIEDDSEENDERQPQSDDGYEKARKIAEVLREKGLVVENVTH